MTSSGPFASLGEQVNESVKTNVPMSAPAADHQWNRRITIVTLVTTGLALAVVIYFVLSPVPRSSSFATSSTVVTTLPSIAFPYGIANPAEPSRMAPPSPTALKGYTLDYVTDFNGNKVPAGWNVFTGVPGGDPGGKFASSHVVVRNGLLTISTWRDPAYQNRWVNGGL